MANENDNDSVNEDDYEPLGEKSGLIFLIDARHSMFKKDFTDAENKKQTKINIALKCIRTVLMNKLIARQKDLIAAVLFGTSKYDDKSKTKNTTLLLDLNYPDAEVVKFLDKFMIEDSEELQSEFGSSEDFLLADALWFCSSLFSHSKANLDEKRILLFTDDSDPHALHPDRAHMARKRAKDLNQVNISLELLPMGIDFDYARFYKELVEIVNGSSDSENVDSTSKLEDLLERVNRLDFKTRRYCKLKWNLGNGMCLGISLYTLFREASVLAKDTLNRATNESVKSVKQTYDQTTGELLLPSDVINFISVGGEELVFSNEERDMLKKVMEPGINLLGFKNASEATEALHCGQISFAYPEETLIKGSRQLVKALVARCIAKKKVALCCMTPRNRAVTKYMYLMPSEETFDSHGNQLTPCGFHVIPLPFYNDTREQKFEKSLPIPDSTVGVAKKLIKKLSFCYKPNQFKNPKLQMLWAHLEAIAFDSDLPEQVEDGTVPDAKAQTERLGMIATDFKDACELEDTKAGSGKRPAASSAASQSNQSSSAKRAKQSCPTVDDVKAAIQSKKVEKFTVEQLKEILTSHEQSVKGLRKPALVDAVYNLKL